MLGATSFGQIPQGINYQAVAYDTNGFELANQQISIRLGILLETTAAESSYTETHQITTNDFGLFSLVISEGTTTDDFSALNWGNGAFLKIELDANLDGDYTLMGVSSFNAVPYALYAETSGNNSSSNSFYYGVLSPEQYEIEKIGNITWSNYDEAYYDWDYDGIYSRYEASININIIEPQELVDALYIGEVMGSVEFENIQYDTLYNNSDNMFSLNGRGHNNMFLSLQLIVQSSDSSDFNVFDTGLPIRYNFITSFGLVTIRDTLVFDFISGCYDENACNFDSTATVFNFDCDFPEIGYDCFGDSVYVDSLNVIECPDGIEFYYQEDIDYFQNNYSSCNSFEHVNIYGDSIYDITFLDNISSIDELNIVNTSISSLDGLDSLVWLNYFYFDDNEALSDISVLVNLNQTPEGFWITDNPQLNNCDVLYELYITGDSINQNGEVYNNGSYCSNNYFANNNFNAACPYPEYLEYDSTAVNFSEEVCQIIAVYGCTDESALNYNYQANINDETCEHNYGCTEPDADNYNEEATADDGNCIYYGCTDISAGNYNEIANTDNGSCLIGGCMNPTADNYAAEVAIDDGTCVIYGCTLSTFPNYNSTATIGNGSCDMSSTDVFGCTDEITWTYNPMATIDNGTCYYGPLPEIGDLILGGIVFYIDESGEHGLVAALEEATYSNDWGYEGYEWGCYQQTVNGADGTAIGTGYQNTLDIVAQSCQAGEVGTTAAQATLDASLEGYNDWYLPSRDELVEMYNSIGYGGSQGNIGGFESDVYWSSSEYDGTEAWQTYFDNGYSDHYYKSEHHRVRIIRAF